MSSSFDLCCVGAGGHGKVVASQFHARTGSSVAFADENGAPGEEVAGFPVRYSVIDEIDADRTIVTIGDNLRRRELQLALLGVGRQLGSFIADDHNYFTDSPGQGTVILAGAVVNACALIGEGVIINTAAIVEHDCNVGDFSHISPNACLAGGAVIGSNSWIGAGAIVLPGVEIAANTIVGAGAVVNRDIDSPGTYVGVPASRVG